MKKPKIFIITGSVRPRRIGRTIADWFYGQAAKQSGMQFEIVDLADWNLPLLDEPIPAKHQMYQHEHTKLWSSKISEADGYVIVTPEYNHGYPASLKNALDYLFHEWGGKPIAFIGYGWGGGRMAVDQLRQVVSELQMSHLAEQVAIQFYPGMFTQYHQIVDPDQTLGIYNGDAAKLVGALESAVGEKS